MWRVDDFLCQNRIYFRKHHLYQLIFSEFYSDADQEFENVYSVGNTALKFVMYRIYDYFFSADEQFAFLCHPS